MVSKHVHLQPCIRQQNVPVKQCGKAHTAKAVNVLQGQNQYTESSMLFKHFYTRGRNIS